MCDCHALNERRLIYLLTYLLTYVPISTFVAQSTSVTDRQMDRRHARCDVALKNEIKTKIEQVNIQCAYTVTHLLIADLVCFTYSLLLLRFI